ncbi:MAG: hypothetical protein WCH58_01830 [Candidatus Saccharibacteria bacterium]
MRKTKKAELERLIYIVMFLVFFILFLAAFFAQTSALLIANSYINNAGYNAILILGNFLLSSIYAFFVGSAVAAVVFLTAKYTLIQFKVIKDDE